MEDAALKRGIALWLGYFTGRYGRQVKRLVMPMPISFVKRLNTTKSACTPRDHHAWQAHSGNWDRQTMVDDIARGLRTGRNYRPTGNLLRSRWLACRPAGDRSKRSVPFALQQRLSWGDAVSSIARIRKTRYCANSGDLTHGMK